jgi:hypothetical protein
VHFYYVNERLTLYIKAVNQHEPNKKLQELATMYKINGYRNVGRSLKRVCYEVTRDFKAFTYRGGGGEAEEEVCGKVTKQTKRLFQVIHL